MENKMDIDWQFHIDQLSQSYTLTDEQVKEGLCALDYARKQYSNLGDETPECIMLFDKHDNMVHKIMTRGAKTETVEVKPPRFNLFGISPKIIVIGGAMIGTIIVVCYLTK
jgi:hypothetical protein